MRRDPVNGTILIVLCELKVHGHGKRWGHSGPTVPAPSKTGRP